MEKPLPDGQIYKKVSFHEEAVSQLVDASNQCLKSLKNKGHISEKEWKCFTFVSFLKFTKDSMMKNCAIPTKKVSEFLDYHVNLVIQNELPYI